MKVRNRRRSGKYGRFSLGLATLVLLFTSTTFGQTNYTVTDLGGLGGWLGCSMGVNNRVWAEFMDTVTGDQALHAGLWIAGLKIDFGTFGGAELNSSIYYHGVNEKGQAVGYAESSSLAPDDFCGFGTGHQCLPFLWQSGVLTALPTLGGTNGVATAINNQGQVAGAAQNTTTDSVCSSFQSVRPAIWRNGKIQELPTYPGDEDGIALSINDDGQAVGNSGCWNPAIGSAPNHALLWDNGNVTYLPSLGGDLYSVPFAINNQGQAVGGSDLAGDTASHAVLWQGGIASDLGTLPGDSASEADGINDGGQVVGASCGEAGCSAFVWADGKMTDLNSLIPVDSPLFLFFAHAINSRGEIVGMAWNGSGFDAFLATPTNPDAAGGNVTRSPGATRPRPKITVSQNVRKLLQKRVGLGRFSWLANPQ